MIDFLKNNKALVVLLVLAGILRFLWLDYSDYGVDEPGTFLFRGLPHKYQVTPVEFILDQPKGPMQILIGFIPYLIVGNYQNELAQRIPFAIFNLASVAVLYLVVLKLTSHKVSAIIAAAFFSVDGLIVGFGRIAQYQSLNMFFSFAALYFYSYLLDKNRVFRYSLLGTALWSLSVLSHWDAVFIVPAIFLLFLKFALRKDLPAFFKRRVILANILLGLLILLPFLVPYMLNYQSNTKNQDYLSSRVGFRETYDLVGLKDKYELYNPFVSFYFFAVAAALGLLTDVWTLMKTKKPFAGLVSIWFIFALTVFSLFVHHAGTHIYNLFIPVFILAGIAGGYAVEAFSGRGKYVVFSVFLLFFGFFYYQTYLIMVDHTKEYPWEQEKIIKMETREYTHKDDLRNKIGFPYSRNWDQINAYIEEQNRINDESLGYITNDDKGISGFYMSVDCRDHDGFYAIGVRRPYSFMNDYKFSQLKGKESVASIEVNGKNMVKIYRVGMEVR